MKRLLIAALVLVWAVPSGAAVLTASYGEETTLPSFERNDWMTLVRLNYAFQTGDFVQIAMLLTRVAIQDATPNRAHQQVAQSEKIRDAAPRIQASQVKQLDSQRQGLQNVAPIQLKQASVFVRR